MPARCPTATAHGTSAVAATEHDSIDMRHMPQEVWSTVTAFLINSRSLQSMSDFESAIPAMSSVSKQAWISVRDLCETAYKKHEVWKMVIPFAVETWISTCCAEQDVHAHISCSSCAEENDHDDDTMGPFFVRGCSECDSVRAINVVSMQFHESTEDTYVTAWTKYMGSAP